VTEINQGRYDQLLRRVGDLKGPGSKVSDALGELFPMIDVENLPPELYLLSGTRLCFGGASEGPSAGNFARVQVFNPADSGNILTVTSAVFSTNTTQIIRWALTTVEHPTVVTAARFRDSRLPVGEAPLGQIRTRDDAGAATPIGVLRVTLAEPVVLQDPNGLAVLAPDTGFEVGADSANTGVRATFYWKERPTQPSEINL